MCSVNMKQYIESLNSDYKVSTVETQSNICKFTIDRSSGPSFRIQVPTNASNQHIKQMIDRCLDLRCGICDDDFINTPTAVCHSCLQGICVPCLLNINKHSTEFSITCPYCAGTFGKTTYTSPDGKITYMLNVILNCPDLEVLKLVVDFIDYFLEQAIEDGQCPKKYLLYVFKGVSEHIGKDRIGNERKVTKDDPIFKAFSTCMLNIYTAI